MIRLASKGWFRMGSFPKLFEPGRIGNVELRNRIIMPAMGNHWAEDGYIVQKQIDYYVERARGGVGLVTTEACCVHLPEGKMFEQTSVDDDKYIPGLSKLAEAVKKNGAKISIQLGHAGAAATLKLTGGLMPVGPSAVHRSGYEQVRALTVTEIKETRDHFIEAAVRAQKAGFDAIELHAAHHYLLAQFHSPAWNERNDEYGGNIRNRARLTMEIVDGIKNRLPEIPVICRFNGTEYGTEEFFGTPGLTLEYALEIARLTETSGADAVHVSVYGWGTEKTRNIPTSAGALLRIAEAIKKAVSVPVIAVGRLLPEVGEAALREGKADFAAIGRGLLADPYLPQRLLAGDVEDIAPCITCYQCMGEPRMNICSVNARSGEEGKYLYPMSKAPRSKKVIVIGGGPGGMESARVAALRGHKVTLYEKEKELGGKLLVADKPSSKENVGLLNPYLKRQLEKAMVKVELGHEAAVDGVLAQHAEAVIVAIGAKPTRPDIRGLEKAHVVDALELLAGKAEAGNKVVIIGGEMVGCEVADVLSELGGKEITIVRRGTELMTETRVPRLRYILLHNLESRGVKFELGVTYKGANENGLVIIDREGNEKLLEADTIVLAAGAQPDTRLLDELKGKIPEVFSVGDAIEPRQILHAIHEGFKVAYSL